MSRKKSPRQPCRIESCQNLSAAGRKGFCNAHYIRQYRYGDAMLPRKHAVAGDPQRFLEHAIAYDGDECLRWPYARNQDGRGNITIGPRPWLVSRLVCEAVYGPPPTPLHHAAHSCGNGHLACVTPNHLRWATPKENVADTIAHGRFKIGERAPNAKLTEQAVREIRALRGKVSHYKLAQLYGVRPATINNVYRGITWAHVS